MNEVTVRFWAAAREAAGRADEAYPAGTLASVLALAVQRHGSRLERVLGLASFLVDGDPVGGREHDVVVLGAGSVLEVLPPFAGG